jgi:signal transduction histidine kinase/DNA-binding response OmpR family regulator
MAASFVLAPWAAFVFAALSAVGYSVVHFSTRSPLTYNFFSVIGFLMMAFVAWLAATSLENALREVRKRAEELDRRVMDRTSDLAEALQREHYEANKNEAVLQSIGDGVIVFDQNRQAIVVNPAACSILECSEADVISYDITKLMGKSVNEDDQAVVRSLIEGGGPPRAGLKITWGRKTVAIGFAPVQLPSTEQGGTVVVLRDITREAEVDRMKSEFVSMVSHELRTPMTAIKGYLELLLTGATADPQMQRSFLEIAKTNADRLGQMVDELLDVSRIEAGKIQMRFQGVSLRRIINDVATMVQKAIGKKDVPLRLNIPEDLPDVLADSGRITQVVTNLISNALKYTLEGHVDVTARIAGDQVQVDVSDTGIGMTEEDQAKLFTRFFRASTARASDISGTGLGLAITRSLIEMHGGKIWVKSIVGQGSTFSFTLPVLPQPLAQLAGSSPAAGTLPRTGPSKVLIVADELHIAQLFRHQLEADDFTVLITTHGKDALPLARHEKPDLILLDVALRDADGFGVLHQLKQDAHTKSIPVVVTSIVAEEERGFAFGTADYLTKPIGDHQLQTSVRRVLAASTADGSTTRPVLVVDDEADIRCWLSLELAGQGFTITEAADGEEALTVVSTDPPGLILLDLNMPKMDGWTVIRKLKENPRTAAIPIIVLTAMPLDAQRDNIQVLGTGVQQFFTKPVPVEAIVEEIRKQFIV